MLLVSTNPRKGHGLWALPSCHLSAAGTHIQNTSEVTKALTVNFNTSVDCALNCTVRRSSMFFAHLTSEEGHRNQAIKFTVPRALSRLWITEHKEQDSMGFVPCPARSRPLTQPLSRKAYLIPEVPLQVRPAAGDVL